MYVYVNWMACKGCGCTDCLFYARKEYRSGNRKSLLVGGKCKLCYLEDKRIYQRLQYINNPRKSTQNYENRRISLKKFRMKHKLKIKEQKRQAYLGRKYENINNMS